MENLVPLTVTAHQVKPVVISIEVEVLVLDLVLENRVILLSTVRLVNFVVVIVNVPYIVLENLVSLIGIVQGVNHVVIALEVEQLVLDLVLENRVLVIRSAHRMNIVVILVKVLLANVLHRVLEDRVITMIPTAGRVNLVVVLINVP